MNSHISKLSSVVSVDWLHDHMKASNLIILDGTIGKVFDLEHIQIPNSRFFDIKKKFSDVDSPFPSTCPSPKQFQKEARALGINKDSAVVVYDDKGIYSSARVWWLFKTFGHDRVAVLNGGLPAWQNKEYITTNMSMYSGEPGNFEARYKPENMVFFEETRQASKNKSHYIIDARSKGRYNSQEQEPRAGLRMGNIPNSVNLPFVDLMDQGVLKSNETIKRLFAKLAKKEDPIIFSCGSGITACVLALGAHISGYNNIAVYDGSWTEWGTLVADD